MTAESDIRSAVLADAPEEEPPEYTVSTASTGTDSLPPKIPVPEAEIDALDPEPSDTFTLASGTEVRVVPLKARQFFRLLRIVTRGGAQVWSMFRLRADMEEGEFVSQLLAMVLFAVPEAEDETFDFIRSMLMPAQVPDDPEVARKAQVSLDAEVDDLGLDDVVSIVEVVVRREGADMQALGKRLSSLLGVAQKTGQLKGTPLSEASLGPST